jgi:CheY-like chemotaxis protein
MREIQAQPQELDIMQQLEKPLSSKQSPSSPPPAAARSSRRVLIVHGDVSYRRTLATYLEAKGLTPIVRVTGRDALRDAADLQLDAVLMDLEGDELDEFELLTRFANFPKRIPAVVCSSYAEAPGPELDELRDLGARRVLPRPCRFDLVVRALCELEEQPVAT